MAGDAGNGKVATREREFAFAVFGHAVARRNETLDRMTALAGTGVSPGGKLPAMLILMAIRALGMRHRFGHTARRVTLRALHRCVLACQREVCLGMVKILGHLRDGQAFGCMTRGAVRTEFAFVNVFVAGLATAEVERLVERALGGPQLVHKLTCGTRKRRELTAVTLDALHRSVFACQRIGRLVVYEFGRRSPTFFGMAGRTVVGQLFAVFIGMTACAVPGKS